MDELSTKPLPFRMTQKFLNYGPVVFFLLTALILVIYILRQGRHGWIFLILALCTLGLAYFGKRVRYNLIERRGRSLKGLRAFIMIQLVFLFTIPWVLRARAEMNDESEKNQFLSETLLGAYSSASQEEKPWRGQVKILLLVAFFSLVVMAGIQAANEYVTFETTGAQADD